MPGSLLMGAVLYPPSALPAVLVHEGEESTDHVWFTSPSTMWMWVWLGRSGGALV
ncbi:hypothetical protein ACWZEH_10250 [Streptomyces sp. QTS137]